MSATPKSTTIERSHEVARWSNRRHRTDLTYFAIVLYRHRDGGYFLLAHGGAALAVPTRLHWVNDDEAIHFLTTHACDPVSGYCYTESEARRVLDGEEWVRGTGAVPEAPNVYAPWQDC